MRHKMRDQRQRDGSVAAQHVAKRQVADRAVLFLRERRIVVDDVRGGREMLAMSYQRPLRRTSCTRGIDDEGGRPRIQSSGLLLEPPDIRFSGCGVQGTVASELVVLVAEHRRVIDHHDPLQFTQFIGERQDLVDVFLIFRDEQHGAAIPHLIFDFGCGGGRIDAIDDGPERLRCEITDHPFLAAVPHDGDSVTLLNSEGCEGARRTRDQLRIVAPASFAVEAEMLGAECDRVRCRPCAFAQQ
jgi:hypothetical protein